MGPVSTGRAGLGAAVGAEEEPVCQERRGREETEEETHGCSVAESQARCVCREARAQSERVAGDPDSGVSLTSSSMDSIGAGPLSHSGRFVG